MPFSVLWKSIFFRGIRLPSTDITRIRINTRKNATFWKTLSRAWSSFLPGVERWKRKTIENETSRYLISGRPRMFHCHFLFFFDKCSISKLISLFLGKILKLVTSDYEFIGRASFITRDNLPWPNCDSDGKARNMRQRTVVWLIYHLSEFQEEVIFFNFPCALEIVSCQWVSVAPPERASHSLLLLPLIKPVVRFARAVVNWSSRSVAKSTYFIPRTTPGRPGN